jgi:hypothetical protein
LRCGTRDEWLATLDEYEAIQQDDRAHVHEVLFQVCSFQRIAARYGRGVARPPVTVVAVSPPGARRAAAYRLEGGRLVKRSADSFEVDLSEGPDHALELLGGEPVLWCAGGWEMIEELNAARRLEDM